ncbi:MAG: hypothetical protein B6245_10850 [Desulfobacteraceae bacterium 4572_88]|nr:MAG: hypothetical protein B6245_10850 [Desulfobacteraceae bacterium 4572_88]
MQDLRFNHAIANAPVSQLRDKGHEVIFHDLYDEKFDPLLFHDEFPREASLPPEIQQHCEEIASADGIVIVHPNWWGQHPAILYSTSEQTELFCGSSASLREIR